MLLLVGLLFRAFVAFWLFPGFDEAYYYLYSQHLDWSYFDHPVLVALTTGFGPWLTGVVSHFTIRLGALILYTLSLLLLYLTAAKLFNPKAAQLTLAIASIIPIFQIGFGILTLPDCPLIFFWSASLYCAAWEFFRSPYQPSYRLTILGVLVGLACLSKYHGFILGFGLVGFCLSSPRYRAALLSPWAGLGLGLFLLTLFPLWYWNWQHDWISFRFQLSNRFEPEPGVTVQKGYRILDAVGVFFAGILYLFPTLGVPLWWVSGRSLFQVFQRTAYQTYSKGRESRHPTPDTRHPHTAHKQRLILWVSLPLMVGFTLLGGYQQILAGWPMPGFWGTTILLGERVQYWQQQSRRSVRRWLRGSALAVICLLLLALLHVTTGTLQKPGQYTLIGIASPDHDPSTELINVGQLRRGFADPGLESALGNSRFIFTNAYYLSGVLGMAIAPLDSIPVTCFSDDPRGFAFWYDTEQWLGEDALYVTIERFYQMPQITAELSDYFRSFKKIAAIPIRRGGVTTEVFHVYQAQTLLKPYPRPYLT